LDFLWAIIVGQRGIGPEVIEFTRAECGTATFTARYGSPENITDAPNSSQCQLTHHKLLQWKIAWLDERLYLSVQNKLISLYSKTILVNVVGYPELVAMIRAYKSILTNTISQVCS
jgi:hypothetical protein